jgi:plastocyanin
MILRIVTVVAALLMSGTAFAGDIRVTLTSGGRPVADAVATVHVAQPPSGPPRFAWPMRIGQRNMQFDPFVLIAPSGAAVAFPNFDDVRHQVYSFSPAGRFELRLYGHDESRSVTFRNVGVIAIGCNIHDQMSAFIYVTDTPYAMKSGADGVARIASVPAGRATLRIWHPYLRSPNTAVERAIVVPAGDLAQTVEIALRAPPHRGRAY